MQARVSKEVQFDAGHRVPNHRSKCRNAHGHRYRLVAVVEGEVSDVEGDSDEGMVIDFGDLKNVLTNIAEIFDHGFIYDDKDGAVSSWEVAMPGLKWIRLPFVPTAENLAEYIYKLVEHELIQAWGKDAPFRLYKVQLWETPTSMAESRGPETE